MPAPEQLTIDTPEQIALEFPLAGVGSRFLAIAFDTLLQGVAMAALGLIALVLVSLAGSVRALSGGGLWVAAIAFAVGFVVYAGYFAIFESIWTGQTPGKRLVGLRVIDVSGRPITVYAAIIRNLLRLVDQLPAMYALGILSVLVTERSQRLGDLAADTVVVHERLERVADAPRTENAAVRLGAHRLTIEEIAVIEGFLRRREELDPWVRLQTARKIAGRMRERLQLAPGQDEEQLLERLASEYRASGSYR